MEDKRKPRPSRLPRPLSEKEFLEYLKRIPGFIEACEAYVNACQNEKMGKKKNFPLPIPNDGV